MFEQLPGEVDQIWAEAFIEMAVRREAVSGGSRGGGSGTPAGGA
ncbi:MAG: hypothetical protein ACLTW9_17300 [Enterocloster sp.]